MAAFDVPKRLHAAQHAAGQPDAITPASIGAAPASRFLTGTGSPEGVTAAAVGTTFTDTATGNQWHKMSGTGVTGWRGPIVLSDDSRLRDTGWRDISSLLINGWGGNVRVRRVGSVVEYRFEGLTSAGASGSALTPPPGFGLGPTYARALLHTTAAAVSRVFVENTQVAPSGHATGAVLYGTLVATTTAPFPSMPYPGTPG